jgi:hypothetical protein
MQATLPARPPATVDGHGAPAVQIPRLAADDVAIDGDLTEGVWARAARLTGFSQYQPVDGRDAEQRTEVRVFYTAKAIYFGIVAHATDPASIRATLADRDRIDNDDRVTIYVDTFNDRRRAFFFVVNPLGVQGDGVRTEGASSAGNTFGGNIDKSPDYQFDSRGRDTDSGYVVEVRIPFKSLRFPATSPQTWGINIMRDVAATGAQDTWTDARKGRSSVLAQSGTLVGIDEVERGVVLEAQPFVTSSLSGARDPVTSRFSHDPMQRDAGLNLRVGLPALSLDATVNPDFSQVESDAGLVTANERFDLFIDEKRPFFLEGIELFNTPNQLVYTRRIVDPAGGAKLTGKLGRFSIAYLSAFDDMHDRPLPARAPGDSTAPRYAAFNVARIRTDYGGSSVAGLTITDRRQGTFTNTVLAADTRFVFRQLYYIEPQLGASWTHGDAAVATTASPLWKLEFDRTGRNWGFNYKLTSIDSAFVSAAGFVPRTGITDFHAFNRLTYLGGPDATLQSAMVFFGPTRIWRDGDFGRRSPMEGEDNANLTFTLRGGWSITASPGRRFYALDPAAYVGLYTSSAGAPGAPYRAPDELSHLLETSVGVTTPVYRIFNASVNLQRNEVAIFAEGSEGREVRATTTLTLRPTTRVRAEASTALSRITRALDGSEYARTIIPRAKVEFQPTRALFFRVVSEYRSERLDQLRDPATGLPLVLASGDPARAALGRGSVRTDWLISYQPTPGTVAFLGYGDTRVSDDPSRLTHLRRDRDGVFVKLAYQFRR